MQQPAYGYGYGQGAPIYTIQGIKSIRKDPKKKRKVKCCCILCIIILVILGIVFGVSYIACQNTKYTTGLRPFEYTAAELGSALDLAIDVDIILGKFVVGISNTLPASTAIKVILEERDNRESKLEDDLLTDPTHSLHSLKIVGPRVDTSEWREKISDISCHRFNAEIQISQAYLTASSNKMKSIKFLVNGGELTWKASEALTLTHASSIESMTCTLSFDGATFDEEFTIKSGRGEPKISNVKAKKITAVTASGNHFYTNVGPLNPCDITQIHTATVNVGKIEYNNKVATDHALFAKITATVTSSSISFSNDPIMKFNLHETVLSSTSSCGSVARERWYIKLAGTKDVSKIVMNTKATSDLVPRTGGLASTHQKELCWPNTFDTCEDLLATNNVIEGSVKARDMGINLF